MNRIGVDKAPKHGGRDPCRRAALPGGTMRSAGTRMSEPPYREWVTAWSGMALLGVANGVSRALYEKRLGEPRAHQVSSATLVAAVLPYAAAMERPWPLPTADA